MKKGLDKTSMFLYNKGQPAGCGGASHGGIAQLGERLNGIQEVSGSIPLISTTRTGEVFASPVFSFYAAFRPLHPSPNKAAKAPRSRSPVSRRGRRARKRPDRPQSGAAAGIYARRSEWAPNAPPEARDARCARLRFPRSALLQSRSCHVARRKKIRPQAAPFFTPLFVARSS